MTVSYADVQSKNMELTPMKVKWQPPGASSYVDLGGTLDNVLINIAYKKADIMADQLGKTVLDRRVSGIDIKVTTSLAEIQNKEVLKVLFPHATEVPNTLTGGSITAASPAVATFTGHGLVEGDIIKFLSGTVPTGVSLNTRYYVLSTGLTADDFEFSLTRGGSAINGSGSAGSGVTLEKVGQGAIDILSAIGDGDQVNAGKLLLHPLSKADADESTDYTIWKACSTAESEVTYGPEGQAKMKIVWQVLPDLSVIPARFMRYGDKDLV